MRQPCALCAGLRRGARAPPGRPAAARYWHGPSSLRAKRPPGERPARGLHVQGLPHSAWAPRRSGRATLGARAGGTGRTLELSLGPLQAPRCGKGFFVCFFLFPTSLQVSRCPTPSSFLGGKHLECLVSPPGLNLRIVTVAHRQLPLAVGAALLSRALPGYGEVGPAPRASVVPEFPRSLRAAVPPLSSPRFLWQRTCPPRSGKLIRESPRPQRGAGCCGV